MKFGYLQERERGTLSANSLPNRTGLLGTGLGPFPNHTRIFNSYFGMVSIQKHLPSGYTLKNTILVSCDHGIQLYFRTSLKGWGGDKAVQ